MTIKQMLDTAEASLREQSAEIERLTIERDEARKLASDWSNKGGAEIEQLREALQMLLDYIDTGDMRSLDLRKARAAIDNRG